MNGRGSSEAGATYSENDKEVYKSTSTTASRWLSIFILGGKRILGVVRRQDKAIKVDQILLIGEIAEEDS